MKLAVHCLFSALFFIIVYTMKTIQESILKNTRTGKYLGHEDLDKDNVYKLWQSGTFNHVAEDVNCQKLNVGDFVFDFYKNRRGLIKNIRGRNLKVYYYNSLLKEYEEYQTTCNYVVKLSDEFIKKVELIL